MESDPVLSAELKKQLSTEIHIGHFQPTGKKEIVSCHSGQCGIEGGEFLKKDETTGWNYYYIPPKVWETTETNCQLRVTVR